MERSVRLNAIFDGLVTYRNRRPDTWREYADAVLSFRETASACFRRLHRCWERLFTEYPPKKTAIGQLPVAEMERCRVLSKTPMFPRLAVDPWGFVSEDKQRASIDIETMQEKSLRRFDAWRKAFRDFDSNVGLVNGNIMDVTAAYLKDQRSQNENDQNVRNGGLFLLNLATTWDCLWSMQLEFRAHFGHFYQANSLDDLERHERRNCQHLWAVATAMRYEPYQRISSVGQMMEREIAQRRSRFIHSLEEEVKGTLGDHGTVFVRQTPWIINEVPHLCVVSDYRDIRSIETTVPRVVEAVWRASQAGGWRDLEWKPLEIEWPKIALMNLVRGKAVSRSCATISTMVLFSTPDAFEVELHHYFALPLKLEDFDSGGFELYESPLLRAISSLQGTTLAFAMMTTSLVQVLKLVADSQLAECDAGLIFARFGHELELALTTARQSYLETTQILDTVPPQHKERWKKDLRQICQSLLFGVDDGSFVSLNLQTFYAWAEEYQAMSEKFRGLMVELAVCALGQEN